MSSLEKELSEIKSFSAELGLNLSKPEDRFKWFLASILFAKRISAEVAKRTFKRFEDSGGYVRYDFSTASNLLECMKKLVEEYGDLEEVHRRAKDSKDLEARLIQFKGFGPVGVNIFLRELRGTWEKADPEPSPIALMVAEKVGLKDTKPYESALVRLHLEYCKKGRCKECRILEFCKEHKL
ncbi:MAG: hypothetical protein QXL67_03155 [Candidatus Bathyarchaeia archaeon]